MVHLATEKSPHVLLFKCFPSYASHIRPFGCRALVSPIRKASPKFCCRLEEGISLAHAGGDIYRILCGNEIITTKHVKFIE